jgi:hypothetical protein
VLSLIFVGLQIGQNTRAVRIATYLQVQDGANQINLATATNADLNRAIQAWRRESFADTLDARVYPFVIAILRNIENAQFMTLQGVYEVAQLNRFAANPVFSSDRFPVFWSRARPRFSPVFQAYVDSIMKARHPIATTSQ